MSQSDSFINEVSEEVRNDRLFRRFRRYGWIGALAIIVVVGGAAWNEYRKATNETEARRLGDAVLGALAIGDAAARAAVLADISSDDAAAAAVVRLVVAGAQADAGDVQAADAALAELAASARVPTVYRDLARLKRLTLAGSGISKAERIAIVEALSDPGAPFRTLAQEQRALIHLEGGENDAALALYRDLLNDAETTGQLAGRARQMILILGGDLDAG